MSIGFEPHVLSKQLAIVRKVFNCRFQNRHFVDLRAHKFADITFSRYKFS